MAEFGSIKWQEQQEERIKYKRKHKIPLDHWDKTYLEVQRRHNKRLRKEFMQSMLYASQTVGKKSKYKGRK